MLRPEWLVPLALLFGALLSILTPNGFTTDLTHVHYEIEIHYVGLDLERNDYTNSAPFRSIKQYLLQHCQLLSDLSESRYNKNSIMALTTVFTKQAVSILRLHS